MEKLTRLISELQFSQDRGLLLSHLKPALSACSRAELRATLPNVNLEVIFNCLNTIDKEEEIQLTCDILQQLLQHLDPGIILDRYLAVMERGLSHPSNSVIILILQQLNRCSQDEDLIHPMVQSTVFGQATSTISGELSVSKETISFLVSLAETPVGLTALVSNQTTEHLQALAATNDTVKFRVLEVMVRVSQMSKDHLAAVEKTGFLNKIVKEVFVDDILVQLNAIELLTQLALTHQGMKYLSETGVIRHLESLLEAPSNDPMAAFILPGIIKFFGNIAHIRPKQVLMEYPSFVTTLFTMTESKDDVQKTVAFETIGYVGISLEGKLSLAEIGNQMTDCIERFGELICDSSTEIRIRAMNAFSSLIKLDKENQSPEYLSLTESWYRGVTSRRNARQPMDIIVNIARQPFPDLRLAAFQLMLVVAGQEWGRREICRHPGLLEFLLDRGTEREKLGKEAKYEIVEVIANSDNIGSMVEQEVVLQLKKFVKEGPFFVKVQSEVAYEGAN